MASHVIQIEVKAQPGQDAEFNKWYDNVHMPDVLKFPGFLSCTRYQIVDGGDRPRYLAAYQVETDDPQALVAELWAAAAEMETSPALDAQSAVVTILKPTGATGAVR